MYYLFEIEGCDYTLLQESRNYTFLEDMKTRLERVFDGEKYVILKDVVWKRVRLK